MRIRPVRIRDVPNHHLKDKVSPKNNQPSRAVQMKFEPVFVTVAAAEDEDPLRDFTNSVHIKALKKNTKRKDDILAITTIVWQTDENVEPSKTFRSRKLHQKLI